MKLFEAKFRELLFRMATMVFVGLKGIGLAPVSLTTIFKSRNSRNTSINVIVYSKMGLLYNLVLSFLVQIMGVLIIPHIISMEYHKKSPLTQALDLIMHLLCVFTTGFIISYWALRQRKAAMILNRFLDVHSLLFTKEQLSNNRTYLFIFLHLGVSVSLWTASLSTHDALHSISDYFVITITRLVIHWFLLEYSIVLGFVARELEKLNKNILNLKVGFPNNFFCTLLPEEHLTILDRLPTKSQLSTLKLLHSVRTTLSELFDEIAEFFSLPILFTVASVFLLLVYGLYFITLPLLSPIALVSWKSVVNTMANILIGIYPLILLVFNAKETVRESRRTGVMIQKFLATARSEEVISELKHFSLQLIHEKVCFTAYGFFALDFTLLQTIFGATTTYLIIIIQFVQAGNDVI